MLLVSWKDLELNKQYYTKMYGNSFGVVNDYRIVRITKIHKLPNDEAMVYATDSKNKIVGLAVGGIFEDPYWGPKNRFWLDDFYAAAG